jgi:hypothetical protein
VVRLVDRDHKWAHEIGRVFIAFGSVEYSVHSLLQTVPRDPIHATTATLRLSQKIDLLMEIMESRSEEHYANAIDCLKAAKRLSEGRNLIAHNPLSLDLYLNDEGEHRLVETIRHLRADKSLSFDDVVELREESEKLASCLLGVQLHLASKSGDAG